jgi:hypothetical protein
MTNGIIKTGDTILWRPCFNTQPPVEAEITGIEICERPRSKYGKPVSWIPADAKDFAVFSLSNHHWCYGEQVETLDELILDYELYYS